jgi:hypothetical protein
MQMERAWFRVDNYFLFWDFVVVIVPTLILLPVVLWPSIRTVNGLNVARSVRARNIE